MAKLVSFMGCKPSKSDQLRSKIRKNFKKKKSSASCRSSVLKPIGVMIKQMGKNREKLEKAHLALVVFTASYCRHADVGRPLSVPNSGFWETGYRPNFMVSYQSAISPDTVLFFFKIFILQMFTIFFFNFVNIKHHGAKISIRYFSYCNSYNRF